MMYWAWLLLWHLAWTSGDGKITQDLYHRLSEQWISHPEPADAYFGYSVAYEPTSKRLIVSAPQHDEIGEIYSCDLNTTDCTSVPKDEKLTKTEKRKHNSWFGAVVKAGSSFFVTCAPRHLQRVSFVSVLSRNRTKTQRDPGTFGRCYKYTDPTRSPALLRTITDKQRKGRGSYLYEHYMDSLGWSIDVSGNDILIGGPAMFTGRAMKYIDDSHDPIAMTGYTGSQRSVQYNYGYSVIIGHFKKSDEKALVYAVGSPYGQAGVGKVLFYELKQYSRVLSYPQELRTNDEFAVGSMFGAVLSSARLSHGSQAESLLVGAPTYADSKSHRYNQGAVYFCAPDYTLPFQCSHGRDRRLNSLMKLIQNQRNCQKYSFLKLTKIVGKDNSYFGSAIMSVGDFNGDGMDEIAISAPYEDSGTGAVYLYSSKEILKTDKDSVAYIQRITPEPMSMVTPPIEPIKSFGLSLASIQDYDENGCSELAIGAPESNKVMVLRCIAFVTVRIYENLPNLNVDRNTMKTGEDNKFTFQSCLETNFPTKPESVTGSIKVAIVLTLNDAKLQATPDEYEVQLNRSEIIQCKDIKVVAPKNGNYEYPIKYTITATEIEPAKNKKDFVPSHVALSDRSELQSSGSIWLTECAIVTNCTPKLILKYGLSVPPDGYVIGSSDPIVLKSFVQNEGEAAYGACVRIYLNSSDVVAVPIGCERIAHLSGALICRPDRALRKQDTPWNLPDMLLQTSHLTSRHESIKITIGVYNHCSRPNDVTNMWFNETIPLKADPRIVIRGMTDSGVDHNVNMTKEDVDGKAFEHTYIITNIGVTNWVNVEAIVVIQMRSFIVYSQIIVSSGKPETTSCELLKKTSESETYSCTIDQVHNEPVKLTIPMVIKYGTLENAIAEKANTQYTSVALHLKGNIIETSETSQLNYGGKIAIWIIVVAVLVGLLILVLFCWLLSRCGFFRREKKESLERVRHSVRRQTIMRRTMMEGLRAPLATEQNSMIASLSVETAQQAAARDRRLRLDSNATKKK